MQSTPSWSKQYDATCFDGRLPRLLEPEILLPSQLYDLGGPGRAVLEGERRLMLAVLEDAVACFQKNAGATGQRGRRLFREAEEWFADQDGSWVFSFEAICTILNINSDYFRVNLARWKEQLLSAPVDGRRKVGRVRLRAARRHKILPVIPRRRHKVAA